MRRFRREWALDRRRWLTSNNNVDFSQLAVHLEPGDMVFIRVRAPFYKKIASVTRAWTNHVGIVVDASVTDPLIAESRVPFSCTTRLSRFVARSEAGRVAVTRLMSSMDTRQQEALRQAVLRRSGVLYDTGFNLHSPRQFCSRFVREIVHEATGIQVGTIETFADLLSRNPEADLRFWRLWYFGKIPWQRETMTPESLLRSAHSYIIFDGHVKRPLLISRHRRAR